MCDIMLFVPRISKFYGRPNFNFDETINVLLRDVNLRM